MINVDPFIQAIRSQMEILMEKAEEQRAFVEALPGREIISSRRFEWKRNAIVPEGTKGKILGTEGSYRIRVYFKGYGARVVEAIPFLREFADLI